MAGPRYRVLLHADFADDLGQLPRNVARRILDAVEDRLGQAPDQYGERLRKSLHGFWKLRVSDYRVVFEILGTEVRVYGAMHRRQVYEKILRRLEQGWTGPRGPGRTGAPS
ncbi:MAG: type II toxin-antitoxin system RelE/ParE family toxin [Deltaproteobacteria bacterium]|nr:type II toxin-antitoxin system RelE/ParE family toxin [Deltaproteobacteria bacterium]